MNLQDLAPALQVSVSPLILIPGIGLLLLSMTNRYAHVIDRTRAMTALLSSATGHRLEVVKIEVPILSRRTRILQLAVTMATVALLLVVSLILSLFLTGLFKIEVAGFVAILFVAAMVFLMLSLVLFMVDINMSLIALQPELDEVARENK
jgi:hypothetical protein